MSGRKLSERHVKGPLIWETERIRYGHSFRKKKAQRRVKAKGGRTWPISFIRFSFEKLHFSNNG